MARNKRLKEALGKLHTPPVLPATVCLLGSEHSVRSAGVSFTICGQDKMKNPIRIAAHE